MKVFAQAPYHHNSKRDPEVHEKRVIDGLRELRRNSIGKVIHQSDRENWRTLSPIFARNIVTCNIGRGTGCSKKRLRSFRTHRRTTVNPFRDSFLVLFLTSRLNEPAIWLRQISPPPVAAKIYIHDITVSSLGQVL